MTETDWGWQGNCWSLIQRMEKVLENDIVPSKEKIIFKVGAEGHEETIFAHKFLLACGSEPFYAMFFGPAADGSATVRIPDFEPAAFRNLVKFLYTDKTEGINSENVMGTLGCAKKYGVPALVAACLQCAEKCISYDNACLILRQAKPENQDLFQARIFDEPKLESLALGVIDRQAENIVAADSFLDIDHDMICEIAARQTLRIKEATLYRGIFRWAEEQRLHFHEDGMEKTEREIIGTAINDIKFPLMNMTDWASGPVKDGVLNSEEVREMVLHFLTPPKPAVRFGTVPRKPLPGPEYTVSRFVSAAHPNPYFNPGNGYYEVATGMQTHTESFTFYVNRDVTFLGCGLYGSAVNGPVVLSAKMTLKTFSTGLLTSEKILCTHSIKVRSDGKAYIVRVLFAEPIQIQALSSYTFEALIAGPVKSYYGKEERAAVDVVTTDPFMANSRDSTCQVFFSRSASTRNHPGVNFASQVANIIFTWP